MAETLEWESRLDNALVRARSEKKHIMLDTFDGTSKGCRQMDEVTYGDERVIKLVSDMIVPFRVAFDAQTLSGHFNVKETPTVILLDASGIEHHRITGFISPEEFLPSILLGISKASIYRDRFSWALVVLERILMDYPKSASVPEAIYLRGICRYRSTYNSRSLKEAFEKLQVDYPTIDWRKWACPGRSLHG